MFCVFPIAHYAVVEGVGDLEHGAKLGGLVADHDVLDLDVVDLLLRPHDGAAHHGGEDRSGEVAASEPALDEPCTVIAHNHLAVAHPPRLHTVLLSPQALNEKYGRSRKDRREKKGCARGRAIGGL